MEPTLFTIELSFSELLNLDGKVSDGVQEIITRAKTAHEESTGLKPKDLQFLTDVIAYARENQKIGYRGDSADYCPVCGWMGEYPLFKSGSRKGLPNTSKQRSTRRGVSLRVTSINFVNSFSLGCCGECWKRVEPFVVDALQNIPCEHSFGGPKTYRRYENYKCSCGWEGHEGQLRYIPSGLGGKCLQCTGCKGRNYMDVRLTPQNTYTLVEIPAPNPATTQLEINVT